MVAPTAFRKSGKLRKNIKNIYFLNILVGKCPTFHLLGGQLSGGQLSGGQLSGGQMSYTQIGSMVVRK